MLVSEITITDRNIDRNVVIVIIIIISNGNRTEWSTIDHFTVVCFVAWPLNEGEAEGDLALIETFLLFLC